MHFDSLMEASKLSEMIILELVLTKQFKARLRSHIKLGASILVTKTTHFIIKFDTNLQTIDAHVHRCLSSAIETCPY